MVSPPVVMGRRCPVGCSLHIAVVGLFVLAGPIAAPPVPTILIHLIMESVVDLGRGKCPAVKTQASHSTEIFCPRSLCLLFKYSTSQLFLKSSILGKFSLFSKVHFKGTH